MSARLRRRTAGRTRRHAKEEPPPLLPAASDSRQPASPVAVARLLRRAKEEPAASGLRPALTHELRALQASHGNRYVQCLVGEFGRPRPRPVPGRATPSLPVAKSGPAFVQRKKESGLLLGEELHLDPDLKAKMEAMRATMEALEPAKTKAGLLSLPLSLEPPPPWLASPKPEESVGEKWREKAGTRPEQVRAAALEKAGAGPAETRAGAGGDLFKALVATGLFDGPLAKLREKAERDFRRLKPGERVLLFTTSAVISGGVLAGIISDPKSRDFALNQLDGLGPDVPGVPGLSVKFMTKPGKLGAMLIYEKRF